MAWTLAHWKRSGYLRIIMKTTTTKTKATKIKLVSLQPILPELQAALAPLEPNTNGDRMDNLLSAETNYQDKRVFVCLYDSKKHAALIKRIDAVVQAFAAAHNLEVAAADRTVSHKVSSGMYGWALTQKA